MPDTVQEEITSDKTKDIEDKNKTVTQTEQQVAIFVQCTFAGILVLQQDLHHFSLIIVIASMHDKCLR